MTEEEAEVGLAAAGTAEAAVAVAEALPAVAKNRAIPKTLIEGFPLAGTHQQPLTAFGTMSCHKNADPSVHVKWS